jgi:hypothetical protein
MHRHALTLCLLTLAACGPDTDDDTSTTGGITASGGGSGGGTTSTTGGGGGTSGTSSSCTDTWSSYGQAFFASTCDSCHQHSSEFSTQAAVQGSRSRIESVISSGAMPQGTSLSSTEKTRILAYLACGAP